VRALIASVQGDDLVSIRDRAVLLLLAIYGLRRGEAAAPRLQDFDLLMAVENRLFLAVARTSARTNRTYSPKCIEEEAHLGCFLIFVMGYQRRFIARQ
jgi:integrase